MPRILFGPFDFDPATLELRRDGTTVGLQSQPARVLRTLIEDADKIVSREELRQAVWGDSTFVDFESGLNFCISQLRSALRDNATQPLYIRTVARRGYQFIAPTRVIVGSAGERVSMSAAGPSVGLEPAAAFRRRIAGVAIALVVALLITFNLAIVMRRYRLDRPPIVGVIRFDNETGNPAFNSFANNLTDELVGELANRGGGLYRVIGNAHVLFVPREQRDLRGIATALNASYVVLGQVQTSGDRIRVLAHLIRTSDQTHIWVVRAERPAAEMPGLDGAIADQVAAAFAARLAQDPERASSFQPGNH